MIVPPEISIYSDGYYGIQIHDVCFNALSSKSVDSAQTPYCMVGVPQLPACCLILSIFLPLLNEKSFHTQRF
jgi:hypothetical protein